MSEPAWVPLGSGATAGGFVTQPNVSISGVTDLAWPAGSATEAMIYLTTAAGASIRGLAAPPAGSGTIVRIMNGGSPVIFNNNDGGTGKAFWLLSGATTVVVRPGEILSFFYDAVYGAWVEIARHVYPTNRPLVTALPAAADGEECILVDSLTAPTYSWHLRYLAAKATNKWLFIGGSPVTMFIATDETSGTAAYVDLATVGPSFTLPVAGQYDFVYSCIAYNNGGNDVLVGLMKNGTFTGSAGAEFAGAVNRYGSVAGQWAATGYAAGDVMKLQYYVYGGTGHFANRALRITPIAVGG